MAIEAMTNAPIALVAALRKTTELFAAAIVLALYASHFWSRAS
jgi:hypothetical protein